MIGPTNLIVFFLLFHDGEHQQLMACLVSLIYSTTVSIAAPKRDLKQLLLRANNSRVFAFLDIIDCTTKCKQANVLKYLHLTSR